MLHLNPNQILPPDIALSACWLTVGEERVRVRRLRWRDATALYDYDRTAPVWEPETLRKLVAGEVVS